MRIALLNPTYWPEVRRGAERMAHDLAAGLTRRGHDVTLLTTHRSGGTRTIEEGFRVWRARRAPSGLLDRHNLEQYVADAPGTAFRLLRGRYDVAHALFHTDAWAAVKTRPLGGPPVVFSPLGICDATSLARRRMRRRLFEGAAGEASVVTALSRVAADNLRSNVDANPEVLPPGVFADDFQPLEPRASQPTIVCTMALNDRRKRAGLLFKAFDRLRCRRPNARLLLAGAHDPQHRTLEASTPPGTEWVAGRPTSALAHAYATSWLSVLPAVNEAFGLVLVESLASGTPVVAARSGASPEIVTSARIGRLFDPDDDIALTNALDDGLDLVQKDGTAEACRRRAMDYEWSRLLPDYETLYERAAADR